MVKPNSNSIGSSSMVLQSSHGSNNGAANKSGKSQYKGVRMRSWGSWVSEIRAPNQKTRIWLGSYSTPEAAARAYDAALICLKGTSASLNFPTSAHRLHLPDAVMSPKSIQRVAAAAAANATTSQSSSATTQTPAFHSPSPSPSQSWEDDDTMMISGEGKEQLDCLFDTSVDYFEAFFQSPKCMDYMMNPSAFFAPPPVEECCWGEEGEISLWSF